MTADAGHGLETLIRGWDGLAVVVHFDAPTGTWIFIALHDDTLGRPVGGCRMKVYPTPADGLRDAMRLAAGMTSKWAAIRQPFGGGKSVLAVPKELQGDEREGLFRRFGQLLTSLQGAYGTGEDLGTTPDDMAVLASATDHVVGGDPSSGHPTDPGPFTALGVFSGMKAALSEVFGSGEVQGRTVLIQGVGDVGDPLARMVAEEGGTVLLSDLDEERAGSLAGELDGRFVPASELYGTECDVFAPCAVGAVLNDDTIPRLACRIVAGSANNQLAVPSDADALHERDILYAPDYVINAGGAMAFGLLHQGLEDLSEVRARVAGLGDALSEIFARARERGVTPLQAAEEQVQSVLAEARKGQD